MSDVDWLFNLSSFEIFAIIIGIIAVFAFLVFLKNKKRHVKVDKTAGSE